MSSFIKLYGAPLSQPFRSVAWLMLLKHCPFEIVLTVPTEKDQPRSSRHESYTSKTKAKYDKIPMLQDAEFCLVQSPAMLSFLCESRGWTDLYGTPGSPRKATIDSYMHWHHLGTRTLATLAAPFVLPGKFQSRESDQTRAQRVLLELERGWLNPSEEEPFIAGNELSIADLLCYEDIVQNTMTDLVSLDDFPAIRGWTQRMQELPYHDEAHAAVKTLGSLVTPNETPMEQRIKAATKAGLVALQSAQSDFTSKL